LGRRSRFSLLIEHDLFRKPVPAFRDHALTERQDPMNETEKARDKPASTERDRDAKRRERDKKLDKALEDSFPASDPISPSAPAPTRD
jgi:hypothetical protein